ncbi:PPOX class probable F420-dependent enzyme [Nocardioides marinisabuli]|uniref:PPOX class probable F420-dependent enzyme n=1 Tax=Nocardioides marinisabuli TaxID=419476 RepID=A0A7Y9F398_9ACTN|nr:PPOX class F420-dependent oxidoreductase [Nocardioides marinisabuli]NYD58828.1 PPOX class probable F420-dependent enzyme [Nocardioides marinisabuli]
MSTAPLPDDVVDLLRRPNPSVVATLRKDGTPVTVPTWYLLETEGPRAGTVLVNMDDTRVRLGHLRRDPRLSLSVLDADSWYTHVTLIGEVVEIQPDEGLVDIDRLSQHYGGRDYPDRESPRTSAWMRIDRWHGWGAAKTD